MSLQFVDFDADGHDDILTATWEGTVFLVRGTADGWQKPEYVRDAAGNLILLGFFYDMQKNDYRNLELAEGDPTGKDDHLISAWAYDWDQDGDLDLLVGAKTGQLYVRRNEGKAGEPRFATRNELLLAGGKPLTVPGGATAMRTVDWDGDGSLDLLCGSFGGAAWLYRNTAKSGEPVFGDAINLLSARPNEAGPEKDWYVDAQDIDGDGDLDLIVGGHYQKIPPKRTLDETERKRLAEVDAELETCTQRYSKLFEDFSKNAATMKPEERQAAMSRIQSRPEYKELSAKLSELRKEKLELDPMPQRTSGIWVYRNRAVAND